MGTKKEEIKKLQSQAEKMYKAGVPLVEIAKKISKPPGTVRRWKSEQEWDGEKRTFGNGKSERSENKGVWKEEKQNKEEKQDKKGEEISGLDGRMEKFCVYYSRTFNGTDAYQWAYGCSRDAAASSASRMLKNVKIQKRIKELKTGAVTRAMLEADDIVEWYIRAAFSDIGSYIDRVKDGEIVLRDLKETDLSLVQEIKNGKYGISLKMVDKEKAMRWLAEHYDLLTKEQQARVELMRKQAGNGAEGQGETGVIILREPEEDDRECVTENVGDMGTSEETGGIAEEK